jgi:glycosyltransferase involved in cell wall biosynthesis
MNYSKAYGRLADRIRRRVRPPRFLCVLLCYNDGDVIEDVIRHMLENRHDIVVWDHGSDDDTPEVLDRYHHMFVERRSIPRDFDFYELYPAMSRNLMEHYTGRYDWISWPDDDEILEGPDRARTYYEHLLDAYYSPYNYIRFNNFNYWFTEADDPGERSPVKRIRHYGIYPTCAPRIRSWRASVTNIREFNHNTLAGEQYPVSFNIRHYPMRTYAQMMRRLERDRAGLQRGIHNYHYNSMKRNISKLRLRPEQLHYDDGSELSHEMKLDWRELYGHPIASPAPPPG